MTGNILIQYLRWHYLERPKNILRGWKNILRFNLEFFSISLLLKTLFSHWRRYSWSYGRGLDLQRYAAAFFSNLISRLLGAAMRSILIFIGFFMEILIILGGVLVFLGWLILPALLIFGLWFGLKIIGLLP